MSPGQTALDAIEGILSRFPDAPLEIERRDASIVITPTKPETFTISIYDEGDEAMIAADRWHAHYDDPVELAWCAYWLLTPFMRLVHELRSGVLVAAWVERYEPEGWSPMDPVFFLNPEDSESWTSAYAWSRRTWQQSVLPLLTPYEQSCPGASLEAPGLPRGTRLGPVLVEADSALGPTLLEL